MSRIVEEPLIKYLAITIASLISAVLLFQVGGSLAEVTGQEATTLGFSFKAGGSIAGFIIIMVISFRIIEKLSSQSSSATMNRIYLKGIVRNQSNTNGTLSCKVYLYDTETGKDRVIDRKHGWENGVLTIYLLPNDFGSTDFYQVLIEDSENKAWESEMYDARAPRIDIKVKPG